MHSKTRIIAAILSLFMIAVSIIAIVLIALTHVGFNKESRLYSGFNANIESWPITDITVQEHPCSYPDLPTLGLSWAGLVPFCSCPLATYKGFCNYKQIRSNCKNKGNVSPISLNKYKGVYICSKKMQSVNYNTISEVDLLSNCPIGTKACGKSSDGSNLCFPAAADCPINDVLFSSEKSANLLDKGYREVAVIYNDTNTDEAPLSGAEKNWFIYYSNKEIGKPLVSGFRLGFQKMACFHPLEQFVGFEQFQYSADADFYVTACSNYSGQQFDRHAQFLDSHNLYKFWAENGVVQKLGNIDFDINNLNFDFDIFSKGYYHLREKCQFKDGIKIKQNKTAIIDTFALSDENYNRSAFFICCYVFLSVALALSGILFILFSFYRHAGFWEIFFGVFFLALLIVSLSLAAVILARFDPRTKFLEKIDGLNCGDDQTNPVISDSSAYSRKLSDFLIATISLLGVCIVAFLIVFLIDAKKNHK